MVLYLIVSSSWQVCRNGRPSATKRDSNVNSITSKKLECKLVFRNENGNAVWELGLKTYLLPNW